MLIVLLIYGSDTYNKSFKRTARRGRLTLALCKRIMNRPFPKLTCPACGIEVSSAMQRKMSPFFTSPKPVACEGCSEFIQWDRSLHRKMIVGGNVFKAGLFLIIISVLFFFLGNSVLGLVSVGISLMIMLAGFLFTATNPKDIKLEKVSNA